MATSGDRYLATSGDFFMATDMLRSLAATRPVFHSEADFQFAFACLKVAGASPRIFSS